MSLHHHVQIVPPVSSSYEISILPFCFIFFGTYQPFHPFEAAFGESWFLNLHVQLIWGVYLILNNYLSWILRWLVTIFATLSETNIGWETTFLWGRPIFRGELLVLGMVPFEPAITTFKTESPFTRPSTVHSSIVPFFKPGQLKKDATMQRSATGRARAMTWFATQIGDLGPRGLGL